MLSTFFSAISQHVELLQVRRIFRVNLIRYVDDIPAFGSAQLHLRINRRYSSMPPIFPVETCMKGYFFVKASTITFLASASRKRQHFQFAFLFRLGNYFIFAVAKKIILSFDYALAWAGCGAAPKLCARHTRY